MKKLEDYGEVLDVSDIQAIMGIGRKQAYDLVHSGRFYVIRVGSRLKIPKYSFEEWLRQPNNE